MPSGVPSQKSRIPAQQSRYPKGDRATKFDLLTFILFLLPAIFADLLGFLLDLVTGFSFLLGDIYILFARVFMYLFLDLNTPKLKLILNITTGAGSLLEAIPVLDALPAATAFIVINYVAVKLEERVDKGLAVAGKAVGAADAAAKAGSVLPGKAGAAARDASKQTAQVRKAIVGLQEKVAEADKEKEAESQPLPEFKSTDQFGMPGPQPAQGPIAQPNKSGKILSLDEARKQNKKAA